MGGHMTMACLSGKGHGKNKHCASVTARDQKIQKYLEEIFYYLGEKIPLYDLEKSSAGGPYPVASSLYETKENPLSLQVKPW